MLSEEGWKQGNPVSFEFEIRDTIKKYDLVLNVNHDVEYDFENCYVQIETSFPDGQITSDQLSFEFTDDLDQWHGTCNRNQCKVSIVLQEKIFFNQLGSYKISIEQYNRKNPLEGIRSLELQIIEAST